MPQHISSEFDPFRVIVSFASAVNNADLFVELFTGFGLRFDVSVEGRNDHSHSMRVRSLRPRVLAAYEGLSVEARMAAANAALGKFTAQRPQSHDELAATLHKIGWGIHDGQLVVQDAQVREMFFPKGSQWDAFVAIREVFDKAQNELLLVDPYCDREFFGLLASSGVRPITVRLLCRIKPTALKAEAETFSRQHPQVSIELRTSQDFHDRFLVVDQVVCVHLGASINHAGSRAFMISAVEDASNRDALIKAVNQAWSAGTPV